MTNTNYNANDLEAIESLMLDLEREHISEVKARARLAKLIVQDCISRELAILACNELNLTK